MRKLALLAGLLALAAMTPATAWAAEAPACPASCVTEYPVPVPVVRNGPFGIAPGPGGMWFGDQDMIVRIDGNGNFTQYTVPSAGAAAGWVARGSDGNMWFTERNVAKVGRMDTSGNLTEYSLTPGSSPQRIVAGPDGARWFTELAGNTVGRITTGGQVTEYPLAPGSHPAGIAAFSGDPAVWVAEFGSSKVARMALDGTATNQYPAPSPAAALLQIAAGPDRALWFTASFLSPNGNKIGLPGPFANDLS